MYIPVGYGIATYVFTSGFLPYGAVSTMGHSHALASGTPDEKAEELYDLFVASVAGALNVAINVERVIFRQGPQDAGLVGEHVGTATGGDGGQMSPPNLCLLVEKHTDLGGRRGRGRMFLPGVSEPIVDGSGVIAGDYLSDVNGNLGLWQDSLETANLNPVLFHSTETAPTPLTSMSLDPKAATQRRRMRR